MGGRDATMDGSRTMDWHQVKTRSPPLMFSLNRSTLTQEIWRANPGRIFRYTAQVTNLALKHFIEPPDPGGQTHTTRPFLCCMGSGLQQIRVTTAVAATTHGLKATGMAEWL
jgi:hypothetical protein